MMSDRAVVILRVLRGLFVVVVFLALPAAAQAVTTVTNTNDSGAGSLRAAIASAPSGDTIDFAPGVSGTITLTSGVLSITQSVTLAGPGAGTLAPGLTSTRDEKPAMGTSGCRRAVVR